MADSDTTPPQLTGLRLDRIDLKLAQRSEADASAFDNYGSGVASISITLDHALATDSGPIQTFTLDTFYRGILQPDYFSVSSPAGLGRYNIIEVRATDQAGNVSVYDQADLTHMGFQAVLEVTNGVASDFDAQFKSDILWQNIDGSISTWSATGLGYANSFRQESYDAHVAPTWHAIETLDFNGDAHSDILYRNDDGRLAIWESGAYDGSSGFGAFRQSSYLDGTVGTEWSVAGAGDLNGDGKDDLLWRRSDGAISTWLSTGNGFEKNSYYNDSVSNAWVVEGLGDFDADGKQDILWRNADGSLAVWKGQAGGFEQSSILHGPVDRSWHIDGIADFNGDAKADILWRNDNGAVSVWESTGHGFQEGLFNATAPTDWAIAQTGDYNGDGVSDILWRNVDGHISQWTSDAARFVQNTYFDYADPSWSIAGHQFPL